MRSHLSRSLLAIVGTALVSLSQEPAQASPAEAWQTIPLAVAGFADDLGARLDAAVADGKLAGLHAVLVVRRGKLALERYYNGEDERWGDPLGRVVFGPEVKHDLRSVSKSVVGLLYGIALDKGQVPALDQPLVDHFPAYPDLAADPERRRITVAHALTMTMGLEWSEDLPYSDPRNSESAMELAPDRYRYVLGRPIVSAPGERWVYSGGATALLARLIVQGSGQPLLDYARETLFAPLGITDAEWVAGRDGEAAAASGLRLRPRDLAKLGQVVPRPGPLGRAPSGAGRLADGVLRGPGRGRGRAGVRLSVVARPAPGGGARAGSPASATAASAWRSSPASTSPWSSWPAATTKPRPGSCRCRVLVDYVFPALSGD